MDVGSAHGNSTLTAARLVISAAPARMGRQQATPLDVAVEAFGKAGAASPAVVTTAAVTRSAPTVAAGRNRETLAEPANLASQDWTARQQQRSQLLQRQALGGRSSRVSSRLVAFSC